MVLAGLVGKVVVGAIARNVVNLGIDTLAKQLNSSEIEKALESALDKAQTQVGDLLPSLNTDNRAWIESFIQECLGTGIGLEELQKPLTQSQKPDAAILVSAFEQKARGDVRIPTVTTEHVTQWMQCFVETYFEQTNTFIRYQVKRQEYLKQLITNCENVKFVGIDVSSRESDRAARLLEIFVVPNVMQEAIAPAPNLAQLIGNSPESLTESQRGMWLEQQERFERDRGTSMSAHQMLSDVRRWVVLLGDPGTGKTTLMRYLSVMVAQGQGETIGLPQSHQWFPVLVYMRDWANHPDRSLSEQVQDFARGTLQVELPQEVFDHYCDGRILLLLDGLDEVADEATRANLVDKANNFLSLHSENWAVVTSRPWGYRRDYFQTDKYPHFELELFSEEQVQEFVEHWYESRCDSNKQAQEMVQDLQAALEGNDRLNNLVKNPLLLTMVALIHRYQDTLPKRRYKLYDRAVDTLLKSWDRKGKGKVYGEFKYLDRDDDLRRILSRLAYWIHTQYDTQTTESGTLIEQKDLYQQLSCIIQEEITGVKLQQAKEEAKRFICFIRDRSGLLNEYGSERYAFVHKTFQEYLTADAILNESEINDSSENIEKVIKDHLHNPHWREVLLLLVGQRKGKGAAKLIELILRQDSPYEQFLHRDLLFAGRCLTEDPERLANIAPELVSEVLERIIALECVPAGKLGNSLKQEIFAILSWLKDTAFPNEALTLYQSQKEAIERWRFLRLQSILGGHQVTKAECVKLFQDKDSNIRYQASKTLLEIGDRSPAVIECLHALLQDEDLNIRYQASVTLVEIGDCSSIVIECLHALRQDTGLYTRSQTSRMLVEIGDRSIESLLSLLQDRDPSICYQASQMLFEIGDFSPVVIEHILALLKHKYPSIRYQALQMLAKIGDPSSAVIECILALLQDEDPSIRSLASKTLVRLGDRAPTVVIESIIALLEDIDSDILEQASATLVRLGDYSYFSSCVNKILEDIEGGSFYFSTEKIKRLWKSDTKVMGKIMTYLSYNADSPAIGGVVDFLWDLTS